MATTHIVEIRVVASGAKSAQNEIEKIGKSAKVAAQALQLFRNFLVLKAIGNVAMDVVRIADSFTILNNKLKATVTDGANIKDLQNSIVDMAYNSRLSVDTVATAFSRFSLGAKDAGVSSDRLLGIIDTLTKQIQLSGATSTEASNAMIQLSQGFASGALRGDELRSVMEQLPVVARSIADALGVQIGELRRLGREGKITTDILIKAEEDAAAKTEEAFKRMTPTIEQSFDQIGVALQQFIGNLENAKGPVASFFHTLAEGLRTANANMFPNAEQRLERITSDIEHLQELRNQSIAGRLVNPLQLFTEPGESGRTLVTDSQIDKALDDMKMLKKVQEEAIAQQKEFVAKRAAVVKKQAEGQKGFGVNQKAEDVLDDLKKRGEVEKYVGRERFIMQEVTKAGVKLESEYGQEIAKSAGSVYDSIEAHKESNKIMKETPQVYNKLRNLEAQVSPLAEAHDKLTDAQEAFNNAARDGVSSTLPLEEVQKRYTREVIGVGNATATYNETLELLKEGLDGGTVSQEEFALATAKAEDAYKSVVITMMKAADPLFAANEAMRMSEIELNEARSKGLVSKEKEAELLTSQARNLAGVGNALDEFNGKKSFLDEQMKLGNVELAEYNVQLRTLTEELSGAAISFVEATSPLAKFNTDIAKAKEMLARENVTGKNVDPATAAEALTRYKRELAGLGNELTDNAEKQRILDQTRAEGTRGTVEEYQKAKNKLLLEEANLRTDAGAGVDRFFLKMKENAMTNADFVEEAFTQTFATMSDAMTDFIETGKLDFKGLVDSIIKDLMRLATQKFMGDLFGQISGEGGGAGGLGNLLNQGLAAVGSMFGSSTPGANPDLAGLDVNQSVDVLQAQGLPTFASGGSFEVGAGTSIGTAAGQYDNRLIAFRAHDGEQVTVNKPGQGGGGQGNITFVLPGVSNYDEFKQSAPQIAAKMHTTAAVAARRMK